MNKVSSIKINEKWIVSKRGEKNKLDPFKPYDFVIEKERTASGRIEDTATIFLTNSECPYKCLMCDLWKNTTNDPVPIGAIPKQIEWALSHLPPSKHLKLYNSGNFFDKNAISEQDYEKIASLVSNFETLIIENHPNLINNKCLRFRDMLKPRLEIAMGLETINPKILLKLNKRLDPKDFQDAVGFLNKNNISSRAFILLGLPFASEAESILWAKESLVFAYNSGVECCSIIPTRTGNGAMDFLKKNNLFCSPDIQSLEHVMEYGIRLNAGRIFVDVWDIELFSGCPKCMEQRKLRLEEMNLYQKIMEPIKCECKSFLI